MNQVSRRSRFLVAAKKIAGEVRDQAVNVRDHSLAWLSPESPSPSLGPHLYSGTTGIALFLAACDRVSGGSENRQTVLRAIAPLRLKLAGLVADPPRAATVKMGIGGIAGLGAFAYAFARIGEWLGDENLVREAGALASLFTPERIAADAALDVVHGSAGAILTLLALAQVFPAVEAEALAAASRAAWHLLSAREGLEPRAWPWPGSHQRPRLSGFAHGAAGICYALLRVYEHTGEEALRDAAREGLVFERTLYVPEERNWRDARFPGSRCMTTWCHGAPGIALARLGVLRLGVLSAADNEGIRQDLDAALDTTRVLGSTSLDDLCCGNMGRAEILLCAHQILRGGDLLNEAQDLALEVLERAEARGAYALWPERIPPAFDPSLFKGISGLGFGFLRLAAPGVLTSPLLLD